MCPSHSTAQKAFTILSAVNSVIQEIRIHSLSHLSLHSCSCPHPVLYCPFPLCLSPSLPNRLRHSRLGRDWTLLQGEWCTCSLPAVCPYRLDCPSRALCVRLASAPLLLCQKADAKLSGLSQDSRVVGKTHSHRKWIHERAASRACRCSWAPFRFRFWECKKKWAGEHQSGCNLNL